MFDRAKAPAILPLSFLQYFAFSLSDLPLVYLFGDIRCELYRQASSAEELEDACRSPAVQRAYAADIAICLAIVTGLSILVSGPYGGLSDRRGRRLVMTCAATLIGVGDLWLCLCGTSRFR